MKCTQYGLYGQTISKNGKGNFLFRSQAEHSIIFCWDLRKIRFAFWGLPGGARSRAPAPIHLPLKFWKGMFRATLHYIGEVHRSVNNFSPRHGYLRRRMVCRRRWKDIKLFLFKLEFSRGQVSCPRLWGCARNLTSGDLPFKNVLPCWQPCHFSIMYKVLHHMTLARSVNHHWTRVSIKFENFPRTHDRWTSLP